MSNIALRHEQTSLEDSELCIAGAYIEEKRVRASKQVLELRPSDCGTLFYAYKTESGAVAYSPAHDDRAGHRANCPICSGQDAGRKANAAFHRLNGFEWDYLLGITLTAPSAFWVDGQDPQTRMADFIDLCRDYMERIHPDLGYILAFHHWRSKDPVGKCHFHAHITAISARYERDEKQRLRVTKRPHWVDNFKPYREAWADILQHEGDVDLHYQFFHRSDYGKINHWLRYVYRGYIEDVDKHYQKSPDEELDFISRHNFEWHMRKWGRRIRSYNCLSNTKRGDWIDLKEVKHRIKKDRMATRTKYHPDTEEQLYRIKGKEAYWPDGLPEGTVFAKTKRIQYVWKQSDIPKIPDFWTIYQLGPRPCMYAEPCVQGLALPNKWQRDSPMQIYQRDMLRGLRTGTPRDAEKS